MSQSSQRTPLKADSTGEVHRIVAGEEGLNGSAEHDDNSDDSLYEEYDDGEDEDEDVKHEEYDDDEEEKVTTFTAATRLLEKRKEMMDVHGTLKSKKEEYQDRLKIIKEKERLLAKKRNELTDNIIELDKFIGDNEIKRTRADQKQKKEEEEKLRSEDVIAQMKKELELLKRERDEKAELLQRDSKYHNYLKSVVSLKGDGDPENIEVLMKRYENLKKHRNHLAEQIEKKKLELNEKRKKQKEDNENWKKTTIELNHIISTYAKNLERIQKENSVSRRRAESSQTNVNELQVTLGKIEMACNNLYNRILDPQHGSRINRTQHAPDEYKMLKVVGDCISDFSYVINQFKQLPDIEKQKSSKSTTT